MLDNELMGFYRVHSQFENAQIIAEHAIQLIHDEHLDGTIEGATAYLNIATLYSSTRIYTRCIRNVSKAHSLYQNI